MARILIVYDAEAGNTEKMAPAVADRAGQVNEIEAIVKKVDNARLEDLEKADGIIMGSPTYYGQMSGTLKSPLDRSVRIQFARLSEEQNPDLCGPGAI